MTATTRLIGPSDFPESLLDIVEFFRDARGRGHLRIRDRISDPACLGSQPNLGLLWQRYFPAHDCKKEVPVDGPFGVKFQSLPALARSNDVANADVECKSARQDWAGRGALSWFVDVADGVQEEIARVNENLLAHVSTRRGNLLSAGGKTRFPEFSNRWRTAMGLGNPSTFENSGTAFHHTYGFPILPGPSLKGVARHFLEEEVVPNPGEVPENLLSRVEKLVPLKDAARLVFGSSAGGDAASSDQDPNEEGGGAQPDAKADPFGEGTVAFHDGWPVPGESSAWFDVDVLTVHHRDYYAGAKPNLAATDTEGTNPVHFLTLRPGTLFVVPLSITGPGRCLEIEQQATLLEFAEHLLTLALKQWGVGGKTGAGYGVMMRL